MLAIKMAILIGTNYNISSWGDRKEGTGDINTLSDFANKNNFSL